MRPIPSMHRRRVHCARNGLAALLLAAAAAAPAAREFRDTLADGSPGPVLVEVPAGRVRLGSLDSEAGRRPAEGPVHEVSVGAFALGRTEVSRGEFAAFVRATGYLTDAERDTPVPDKSDTYGCFVPVGSLKPEWKRGSSWRAFGVAQDDRHPVACISWNDAQAYVSWLGRATGKAYRLPTEAEQEYAIRAGSTTPWPWGENPDGGCRFANGADISGRAYARSAFGVVSTVMFASSHCDDGHGATAPVASLAPNAFGLYDTVGNVSEWSGDCYIPYARQLAGERPAAAADCVRYAIRGMAWSDEPVWLRSAIRMLLPRTSRYHNVGLRVARDL